MKLVFVFTVILAFSLADEFENEDFSEDLQAAESVDLQKNYIPPAARRQRNWYTQNTNPNPVKPPVQNTYFPNQNDPSQNGYNNQPQNGYNNGNSWNTDKDNQNPWAGNAWNQNKQQNNWNNQQNSWSNQNAGSQNSWNKPVNQGSQNNWNKPENNGAQNNWNKPAISGSGNNWNKPSNVGSQNNWNNINQNSPAPSSTTTQVAIIKNEQSLGDNGSYKYEYQIADGTHVAEEGYFTDPNSQDESLVKKGFYSFTGADGKVYSVTYWADKTGFHAIGDHIPKPPPVPAAIQASIDQNAKEEAAKAEAEKNQQQQSGYYPSGEESPKPIAPQPIQPAPQRPIQPYPLNPTQSYPQQESIQPGYPQQEYPQQGYPQQQYPQQQQNNYQNQQSSYPSQNQNIPSYGK